MSEHADIQDASLVFQIDFWSTTSEIFYAFGADIDNPSMPDRLAEIKRFEQAYNQLHMRWYALVHRKHWHVGPYSESLDLYIHCGKLYLYSHGFRGRQHISATAQATSKDMKMFEEVAVHSALSMIISTADMEDHSSGASLSMPSYFWTMLAFAIVVLHKLEESASRHIGKAELTDQLDRLYTTLSKQESSVRPWHPLSTVMKALQRVLGRDMPAAEIESTNHDPRTEEDLPMDFNYSFDDMFGFDSFSGFDFNDPVFGGQITTSQPPSDSHDHYGMI